MTDTDPAWVYTAGPFEAFGHSFALHTTDAEFGQYLEQLWAACRSNREADATYGLAAVPAMEDSASTYHLYVGDTVVREYDNPSIALRDLVRHVNAGVITAARDLVVVHASGAVRDGKGVVFPAAMEAGKTTLVAGLVQAGWGYLSDEAIGIDPPTLELRAYPKPLSVDSGSWRVLADLEPALPDTLKSYAAAQWQIAPRAIRADPVPQSVPPAMVIGPVYEPDADTTLESLTNPQALMLLAESCFTLRGRAAQSLKVLAALASRCSCFRLRIGNLETACALVAQALESRT